MSLRAQWLPLCTHAAVYSRRCVLTPLCTHALWRRLMYDRAMASEELGEPAAALADLDALLASGAEQVGAARVAYSRGRVLLSLHRFSEALGESLVALNHKNVCACEADGAWLQRSLSGRWR